MKDKQEVLYVLYDGRAEYDVDAAIVYVTADTEREARRWKREDFTDAVIMRYDVDLSDGKTLINETRINVPEPPTP